MASAADPRCDLGMAVTVAAQDQPTHPRLVLATTILASSLAMVDGSVVNVGLPAIGRSLRADAADLQWVVNAYLLPLSALLLLGGALGDRFGRRRLLVVGVVLFAIASAGCAAAPSAGWLLLARGAQGVGAALLMPNSLAMLGASFSGEARGRAIGAWAASGAVAAAIGPVLGGWLIDGFGWSTIFLVNLPIAAVAVALAQAFVPADRRQDGVSLDAAGALLATAALGTLTWGLTMGAGPRGWTRTAAAVVVAGLALLAGFAAVERRLGKQAMVPLNMFASPSFVGLSVLTLLVYGVLGGLLILLPYVLIRAGGYSATQAGAALLPFPVLMAIGAPIMGRFAGRFGSRLPLAVGPLITGAGLLLTLNIRAGGDYWTSVVPPLVIVALGMAAVAAPLTTAVLASVDTEHEGSASGLNSALARTGGLIATALLGAILASRGPTLVAGFHVAALVGAGCCACAAACAFALVRSRP